MKACELRLEVRSRYRCSVLVLSIIGMLVLCLGHGNANFGCVLKND